MNKTLSFFFEALNRQEKKFLPKLEADNLGLYIRSAINELDWYHYNISRKESPSYDETEQYYIMKLGVGRLIQLSLDARPTFDVPTIMFTRKKEITIPVLELAAGLGFIEHGRRVAQTVSTGLCNIESPDGKEFIITLPPKLPDDEYYERELAEHYRRESIRHFNDTRHSIFEEDLESDIEKILEELVFPFCTHFIGYGGDSLLDHYFYSVAFGKLRTLEGYDTFNHATRFGGIQLQNYVIALNFTNSISIRHERFAEALVKKDPSIKLENILTISAETESFIKVLRDAINIFGADNLDFEGVSIEDTQRIFEVLSCSRKNTALLAKPGSPFPHLIQSTDQGFIRSLTGAGSNTMLLLLESLRYHYPKDYDKNQQSREKSMQTAIKRVLNDGFEGLEYLENIKIKMDGKVVTDIDLVVLEKTSGTVFLCQLKFQELYGDDLHSKQIRGKRLKEEATRWLASLNEWIEHVGEAGVRTSLRLPKGFPKLNLFRLIIAKHYSYPLKDLTRQKNTAHANWYHFFNSVELTKLEKHASTKSLSDLISTIKKTEQPHGPKAHNDEPLSNEYILDDDLKFKIIHKTDSC
ncbi:MULTISPECIES: hypothetical protein [Pseudomonas]|uniref:hypothetical protein n=1 Tax=Pseudomonas TaxID=286 RepID=UPI0010707AAF|nr:MULTISPECIES: hypothetical protein [Pseudomonas]QBR30817.1 hypothetical protein E3Z29_09805 [Pseudomonas sp. S150]UZT94325.1 hypothetical protein OPS05_07090 [Pseudomonas koreensis]